MIDCTACGSSCQPKPIPHPLLDVPICRSCYRAYNTGEFTIENDNEIYCRWCGEGEGILYCCDSCPKSFCSGCIQRNFGSSELSRVKNLSNRWSCFVCSPENLIDYCQKNGWQSNLEEKIARSQNIYFSSASSGASSISPYQKRKNAKVICSDISRGREKYEIPVINEFDSCKPPLDFVYVTRPVPGDEKVFITNNPSFMTCCSCVDDCSDPTKCECALLMDGIFPYDSQGLYVHEKMDGVYECNDYCSCHINRCPNRVVSRGPAVKLEVFRCSNPSKGWGVRSTTDIPAGTFIADYLGEILHEQSAEERGMNKSDEYLFNLDWAARTLACQRLSSLGMKRGLSVIPREMDIDVTMKEKLEIREILGDMKYCPVNEHRRRLINIEKEKRIQEKEQSGKKNLSSSNHNNNDDEKVEQNEEDEKIKAREEGEEEEGEKEDSELDYLKIDPNESTKYSSFYQFLEKKGCIKRAEELGRKKLINKNKHGSIKQQQLLMKKQQQQQLKQKLDKEIEKDEEKDIEVEDKDDSEAKEGTDEFKTNKQQQQLSPLKRSKISTPFSTTSSSSSSSSSLFSSDMYCRETAYQTPPISFSSSSSSSNSSSSSSSTSSSSYPSSSSSSSSSNFPPVPPPASSSPSSSSFPPSFSRRYLRSDIPRSAHPTPSWIDTQMNERLKRWRDARSVLTDRVMIETEGMHDTYTIDARWFGNVGRFFNNSCDPNMEKVTVFCESQDTRYPRLAFFSSCYIKAGTELCYNYGYLPGNVVGKERECMCGSINCTKKWY